MAMMKRGFAEVAAVTHAASASLANTADLKKLMSTHHQHVNYRSSNGSSGDAAISPASLTNSAAATSAASTMTLSSTSTPGVGVAGGTSGAVATTSPLPPLPPRRPRPPLLPPPTTALTTTSSNNSTTSSSSLSLSLLSASDLVLPEHNGGSASAAAAYTTRMTTAPVSHHHHHHRSGSSHGSAAKVASAAATTHRCNDGGSSGSYAQGHAAHHQHQQQQQQMLLQHRERVRAVGCSSSRIHEPFGDVPPDDSVNLSANSTQSRNSRNQSMTNDLSNSSSVSSSDADNNGGSSSSSTRALSSAMTTAAAATAAPTRVSTASDLPVFRETPGLRCGPLPRYYKSLRCDVHDASATHELVAKLHAEYGNLSPFRSCKFVHFLPPRNDGDGVAGRRNTLVLDLDETLVHTSMYYMADADAVVNVDNSAAPRPLPPSAVPTQPPAPSSSSSSSRSLLYIKYRPHLYAFLRYCLAHFEVVIFTAGLKNYVHAVVQCIERDLPGIRIREQRNGGAASARSSSGSSDGRASRSATSIGGGGGGGDDGGATPTYGTITLLHRDHCTPTNAGYVKDLYLLGRDLRRTIFIDNNVICGVFQPFNCVQVKDFVRRTLVEDGASGTEEAANGNSSSNSSNNNSGGSSSRSRAVALANAAAAAAAAEVSVSTSAQRVVMRWDDPDDNVLEVLMQEGGLLDNLRCCDDAPHYIARMMLYNCNT